MCMTMVQLQSNINILMVKIKSLKMAYRHLRKEMTSSQLNEP